MSFEAGQGDPSTVPLHAQSCRTLCSRAPASARTNAASSQLWRPSLAPCASRIPCSLPGPPPTEDGARLASSPAPRCSWPAACPSSAPSPLLSAPPCPACAPEPPARWLSASASAMRRAPTCRRRARHWPGHCALALTGLRRARCAGRPPAAAAHGIGLCTARRP